MVWLHESVSLWCVINIVFLLAVQSGQIGDVDVSCYFVLMLALTSFLLRPVPFSLQELTEEVVGSPIPETRQRSRLYRSHSESSDEVSELDLSHGKKDAFVLEVFIHRNK